MKNYPLVTIIIPVYNAEKYLNECCNSVLSQSYKNIELILIDDGSTDSSKRICDMFANEDKRVKVIHQINSGVSVARNIGIKSANGDYMIFVDADDILPEESVLKRVNSVINSDVVISSYCVIDDQKHILRRMPKATYYSWNQEEAIIYLFAESEIGYQGYLWNKIYKTSIVKKNAIFFTKGIAYNEDTLFNLEYFLKCQKITINNDCVYCYRTNSSGAMESIKKINDKNSEKYMSEFKAFDILRRKLNKKYNTAYAYCVENEMRRAIVLYKHLEKESSIKTRNKLSRIARECAMTVLLSRGKISIKRKIIILCHGVLLR